MGRYDFRPSRVHQAAALLIQTGRVKKQPPWYEVVENNTPPQILVRPLPVQHTGHRTKARKPSKLFKPQNITYPEDSLRKTFFTDHPWELARPRMVLEDSGADYRDSQWDSIRQDGGHLSGEKLIKPYSIGVNKLTKSLASFKGRLGSWSEEACPKTMHTAKLDKNSINKDYERI